MNKVKNILNKIRDFVRKVFRIKKPSILSKLKGNLNLKNFKVNKLGISLIAAVIILGLLYYFRGIFIVATVNGQPIFRYQIVDRLEKASGKDTLDGVITEMLVMQEGKKLGAIPTKAEVDAEISKIREDIKKSSMTLEAVLAQQGISAAEFEQRLKLQKTVEKILETKSVVTEEEIAAFIEANKDSIPEGMQQEELRTLAREQLKSQKLGSEFETWLGMVRAKSSIQYLKEYK